MMSNPAAIVAALKQCNTIIISAHRNPDGDALGSQLALMIALERIGKTVVAHNLDIVPDIYRFLPQHGRIVTGKNVTGRFDACVVVDADPPRAGLFDKSYPADVLINIDHHITNPLMWPLTWLDPDVSACGEMIYTIIKELGVAIDREIALCLYTAIFTDTGSFRYSNTTPRSMRIAAEMIEAGADPWLVTENVYESFAYKRLKLLGTVLSGVEKSADGRIAWVIVTRELFQQTGTTAEDTDNFVNFVRSIKGVEVAIFFRQTDVEEYKISMRSKGRVDVSGLAQLLGGGGHKNAAGGIQTGTLDEVRNTVLREVGRTVAAQLGG